MATRTGNFIVHDVTLMREAFVVQDTRLTVAFVAHRINRGAFWLPVSEDHLPLKDRTELRSVGPARTGAASGWRLIVIVTIAARHRARDRPRLDETRHEGILPNRFEGMERRIRSGELQALICLRDLPRHDRGTTTDTVAVTAGAKL